MKPPYILLIFLLFFRITVFSQEIEHKKLTAIRIDKPLVIDGELNEPFYRKAPKATGFVQLNPYNGEPSYEQTKVQIFYDNNALYVGAMLYDNPDSIRNYITTRDHLGSSDYFDVVIDPNNEGLTAFEFVVTPANAQCDIKAIKHGGGDNEDTSWDAVWQSVTKINERGWAVEYRIPYSALRFPEKQEMVWGINFFRRIRRFNSNNSWNRVHNKISGFIQQSGELHGLKNIKAPVRLSISPYVAGYVEKNSTKANADFVFKGGLDLKYGLSKSHTLDMMLIPDFGQIQSDDEELNLSPFELYYDEKRQFFIEGVELFNRANIFYSRRIGRKPIFSESAHENLEENEKVTFNPSETQMVNATKVSGRNKDGWGVGLLNAMTLASNAEVTDTTTGAKRHVETQPFTNYNIAVVEKALKNSSYVSIINTNMSMVGNPYCANVTATEFQFKNQNQTYQLAGSGGVSFRNAETSELGYNYNLGFSKTKGQFRFDIDYLTRSEDYNPNDLGYLKRNNIKELDVELVYNFPDPFWIFKNMYNEISFENGRLQNPNNLIGNKIDAFSGAKFQNNLWLGLYLAHNFGQNDYFETRVNSRYYSLPSHNIFELNFNTDNNLPLSGSTSAGTYIADNEDINGYWLNASIWWKANQKLSFQYSIHNSKDNRLAGHVNHFNEDSIYFGIYYRNTLTNTIGVDYNFNTKMSLDFRLRHYWSWADYVDIKWLNTDGTLSSQNSYETNADINFNAFNIDMTFKWEFAPGSLLSVVWKNAIYNEQDEIGFSYLKNLTNTLKLDQTNSISLKLLYYIDLNSTFNKH